ncbi:hypothetical protein AMECASPLE_013417 [Ameca splendens]|uniref:Uncharacterized protein n=1 Tax=Ameca splendens TaxID=208324 RepID=A0ABV0Y1C3_9TELE
MNYTAAHSLIFDVFPAHLLLSCSFSKKSLAHPTCVKGEGALKFNKKVSSDNSLIENTQVYTKQHTHTYPSGTLGVMQGTPSRAVSQCQQVSGQGGQNFVSSTDCQTYVLNIAHKFKFIYELKPTVLVNAFLQRQGCQRLQRLPALFCQYWSE